MEGLGGSPHSPGCSLGDVRRSHSTWGVSSSPGSRNAELMHILWIKGPGGGVSWGVKCGPRVAGWLEDSGCGSDQWLVESRELVPRSVSDPTNAPRNHLPAASDAPAFPASLQPITLEEEQSRS